jgi:S-DNA-T family DNA segregation ATPase FtsK/SpoIIIE
MGERFLRGFALTALFAFFCVSWVTYDPMQWPAPLTWDTLSSTLHPCGPLGLLAAHASVILFGRVFSVVVLVSLAALGFAALWGSERRHALRLQGRLYAIAALGTAVAALTVGERAGGLVGDLELQVVGAVLGRVGTTILLATVGSWLLLRFSMPVLRPVFSNSDAVRDHVHEAGHAARLFWSRLLDDVRSLWQPGPEEAGEVDELFEPPASRQPATALPRSRRLEAAEDSEASSPRIRNARVDARPRVVEVPGAVAHSEREEARGGAAVEAKFELPTLEILREVTETEAATPDDEYLNLSRTLEEKLADFGIGGRVSEVQPGPVITTYEFEPAPGIKVSQITSRVDDLAMALRAQSIRMVAPIPGKAAIGIEIPNSSACAVSLREIIGSWSDDLHVGPLGLALGKTVSGEPFFADLSAMPHLLVAGATGSGKSVCINVLLCSLLLRHNPNEVKLLLIDPKMLELNAYRDIPHLLHPVVTEPKDAYKALHWMTLEMERRYRELARTGVRNIVGYNKKARAGELLDERGELRAPLPYVVVIVDELADLMIQVGGEIETPIARLAQMARAVGIHLVLATQRPSVDVLTGVIKANFPSRIAFQVSSRVDSRTILDANGAEMLLGRGDMLFLAGGRPTPIRLHGAFVGVEECERIAAHWRSFGLGAGKLDLDERIAALGDAPGDDDMFDSARDLIVHSGVASVSYLQRRLKVGYSRAARIMDMLEEAGVVGPSVGSKPREILLQPEDLSPSVD